MHIFPYSRRTGTRAARMPGQIPNRVKEERAHRAAQVAGEMELAWLASWAGEVLPVLFEEEKDGLWRGHAPNYAQVFAPGEDLHGRELPVEIVGAGEHGLLGRVSG